MTGREHLDPFTLGWLVGVIEGEGCFTTSKPQQRTYAKFTLTMTDRDVVERVAQLLGVKVTSVRARDLTKWKQTYNVQMVGQRATQLFLELEPYMSDRRQARIREVLAQQEIPVSLPLFSYSVAV